jgi:hypothetical protein
VRHRARLRRKANPIQPLYDLVPPATGTSILLILAASSIGGSAYWAIKGNAWQMLLSAVLPLWGAVSAVLSVVTGLLAG